MDRGVTPSTRKNAGWARSEQAHRLAGTTYGRGERIRRAALAAIARRELILQMLALGAAGCHRGNQAASRARASTAIIGYDIDALNPAVDNAAKFLVFLPLVARDRNGQPEARLAVRWGHSADYREWTYSLRTDVRWHDGLPVTARDVKFTLDLGMHPDVLSPQGINIDSSTVVDESTIVVRYARPVAEPDWWVVYYPKHLLEDSDPTRFYAWDFWSHPVGNGAYRFVRSVPNTMMELAANPDYYRGQPRIGRVTLKFVAEDRQAGLVDLLSGNIDVLDEASPAQIPALAAERRFRVYHRYAGNAAWGLYWQLKHPLFRDARVRRALTLSINRRELQQAANLPEGPVVDGPYTARQLQRRELGSPVPFDRALARRLLDETGWRDLDGDGVRERDGHPFRFTVVVSSYGTFGNMELYVQEQFRQVGVQMDIQTVDQGVLNERRDNGEFEALLGFVSSEATWLQKYFARNPIGYRNPRLLDLLDRAGTTVVPEAEDGVYRELLEIFRTDAPITFLFPRVNYQFAHRRVRGLSSPWWADAVEHMEDLWLEDEPKR